jgi:hypothetical protein
MAAELVDLKRLKITGATRAWLQAKARATGKSHQDVARDALHELALQEIHAAKVLVALSTAEGLIGDDEGHSRDSRGREGSTRK